MIEFEAMALSAELQKAIAGESVKMDSPFPPRYSLWNMVQPSAKKLREKRAHLSVKSPQAHAKADRFIE